MAINKDSKGGTEKLVLSLDTKVDALNERLSQLSLTNSQLLDEVSTLKRNYNRLVEDVNTRLEVVHQKLFRKE